MSESSQTATHAPCRAEAAADGTARCHAVTGEARRPVRGVWLVPPTTGAQERAELAREGAEVRDGWWIKVPVWTAGDGA